MTNTIPSNYKLLPRNPEYVAMTEPHQCMEFVYIKTVSVDTKYGEQSVWYIKDSMGEFKYINTTQILMDYDKLLVPGKQYILELLGSEFTKSGHNMKMYNLYIKTSK